MTVHWPYENQATSGTTWTWAMQPVYQRGPLSRLRRRLAGTRLWWLGNQVEHARLFLWRLSR